MKGIVSRAVLDTNVLISALIFRGSTNTLVPLWQQGKIRPLVSKVVLIEYLRALSYPKYGLSKSEVPALDELFSVVGGAREFIEGLGVSTRLSSYGVQAGKLEKFVDKVVVKSDIQITPAPVGRMDILNIFQSAM